jgi:hypothetical protein
MTAPNSVRARVTVEVEVTCPSSWSSSTSMEQITKQATEDAKGILHGVKHSRIRIIGTPIVTAVLATEGN